MTFRQAWVVEVAGRIVDHAELFHHPARALVLRRRERDKTGESKLLEGMADHGTRSLRGQAAAPIARTEPPADLNCRHEGRFEGGDRKTDETDEGLLLDEFGGEEA